MSVYEDPDDLGYILALDGSPLYEECPDCGGVGNMCFTCFDTGLVPHTDETCNLGQMDAGDTRDGTETSSTLWTGDGVPPAAPGAYKGPGE